jgi:hypothetical protein
MYAPPAHGKSTWLDYGETIRASPASTVIPMVSKVGWRGHPADLFSKFSVLLGVRLPPPSFVSAAVFVLFGLEETPEEIIFNIPS